MCGCSQPVYVKNQVLQCVSILWKRSWCDNPEASLAGFMAQAQQLARSGHTGAELLGLKLVLFLVREFVQHKASSMGMTREFHAQANVAFDVWRAARADCCSRALTSAAT